MKTLQILILLALLPILGFSQSVRFTEKFNPSSVGNNTLKQDSDFINRRCIPYPFIGESDVMWSKVAWEIIDLRERMNLSLYYPLDTVIGRKSFVQAVVDGILLGKLYAYKPGIKINSFEFDVKNDIYPILDTIKKLDYYEYPYKSSRTGIRDTVRQPWRPEEITQLIVKEIWYFDRKYSELKCEIIGLCLEREYNHYDGYIDASDSLTFKHTKNHLLWINFPEARKYLATIPVYDQNTDKEMYSFDDLFVNRKFRSYFVREANVFNNRYITDYVSDRDAQLESERIKKEIFDYEQDLWEN
jgi:gliding motility associated protien GldN